MQQFLTSKGFSNFHLFNQSLTNFSGHGNNGKVFYYDMEAYVDLPTATKYSILFSNIQKIHFAYLKAHIIKQ